MTLTNSPAPTYATARSPAIFISYRRQEASYLAGWLHDSLALSFGADRVFLDIDSIKPGVPFADAVDQAISNLTVLLVLIGPTWSTINVEGESRLYNEDDPVRLEIETAFRRGARVLPVLLEDTTMPEIDDLPASLARLTGINALRLRYDSARRDIVHLTSVVERLIDPASESTHQQIAVSGFEMSDQALPSTGPSPSHRSGGEDIQLRRLHAACLDFYRAFASEALRGGELIQLPLAFKVSTALVGRPGDRLLPTQSRMDLDQVTDRSLLRIFHDFGAFDGDGMLLLGAPGAGKTLELIELARLLSEQRLDKETLPLPIYLPLANWGARQQPLLAWVIEQLDQLYLVPPDLSRQWINDGRLMFLLDGLDEIPEATVRSACVLEINRFLRFGRPVRSALVVSSRPAEYEMLNVRLNLDVAVSICPMNPDVVLDHLSRSRSTDRSLRLLVDQLPSLRDLLQTPLLVSMVTLGGIEALRSTRSTDPKWAVHVLVENYVNQRLNQGTSMAGGYSVKNTRRWLSWVARHLSDDRQTVLLVDRIPSRWATSLLARRLMICGPLIIYGALTGATFGIALTIAELRGEAGQAPATTAFSIFVVALITGLISGWSLRTRICVWVLFGYVMAWISGAQASGVYLFAAVGLYLALLYGLIGEVAHRLLGHELPLMEQVSWSWSHARSVLPRALILGLIFGLTYDVSNWLFTGGAILDVLVIGVVFGTVLGISLGLTLGLTPGLRSTPIPVHVSPYDGLRRSARYGILVGLSVLPIVSIMFWLSGLLLGPFLAVIRGLSWGVGAGVLWGLASGFGAVIQYACLRAVLWISGDMPLRCVKWLDHAVALRILYRGPGGGYLFIHSVVQDFFFAHSGAVEAKHETHA